VTDDGRLGFGSPEVSSVKTDSFSSPVNLGGGRRCSFNVPCATLEWIQVTALADFSMLWDSASRLAGEWCLGVGLGGRRWPASCLCPQGDLNVISFLPGS
jgi:hypothetical protein